MDLIFPKLKSSKNKNLFSFFFASLESSKKIDLILKKLEKQQFNFCKLKKTQKALHLISCNLKKLKNIKNHGFNFLQTKK